MNQSQKTSPEFKNYVIIDTETTGFSYRMHRVIEIGAIKIRNGKIAATYQQLLNDVPYVPKHITKITGITGQMLNDEGRCHDEILPEFRDFIGDDTFVAHNVYFDFNFLNAEFIRHGLPILQSNRICTMRTAKAALPSLPNYKLTTIKQLFHLRQISHRALEDAEVCWEIMKKFGNFANVYNSPVDQSKYSGIAVY